MFRARVKGKILKLIQSILEDTGKIYEQTVIIELQDGTAFYLFDSEVSVRDEMVGTIKTIGIGADLAHVEKIPFPKKGVETTYRLPEDPAEQERIYARDDADFAGEIVDLDGNNQNLYIDIGMGTIGVDLCWQERDSFSDYRIGDYIRVTRSRNGVVGAWDFYDEGGSGWAHIVHNHINVPSDTPTGNQFYLSFGWEFARQEKIKDLIMAGAQDGVEVKKNVYHYVEPTSRKTLRLFIADNGYIVTGHPYTDYAVTDAVKEKLKVPVRIVGVRPDAEYQDTVYTQLVIVEFANGTRASVFDDDLLCTPAMVGKDGKIVLGMLSTSLGKNETKEQSIFPEPSVFPDVSVPALEVNGHIDAIIVPSDPEQAERWHDAVVDFGVGKTLIRIDAVYFRHQFTAGDYIRVNGRVDLKAIE